MSEAITAPAWVRHRLREGLVIPAHPLALTRARKLDERHQRALTRYYHAAGAGGVGVGVHTTQFAIRAPEHGLLEPVLELAAETIGACDAATGRHTVLVAGVCGGTRQAVAEARLARDIGYHAGLLSLGALANAGDATLLEHCRTVAKEIDLFGFYLQPAAGGRLLSPHFWRGFLELPNVIAIKIAPFNRYQTLDVIRAVAEVGRAGDVALYTGNDDNIVVDLLTDHEIPLVGRTETVRIVGGLLGQWACGTARAVGILETCRQARTAGVIPASLLTLAAELTDCNAALFDAAHGFAGCIPGIHEVLVRQGLLAENLCLDPHEMLSPGQTEEIERVCRAYPHLHDDEFVARHLAGWLE
jgi:dihydrodipicolinate synthase/N-acetylneuraminate lyase